MTDNSESTEFGGPAPAEAGGPAGPAAATRTGTPIGRAWRRYRAWRRSRPFWAGLWLIIAGAELLLIPLPIHSMGVILHIGIGGISGILIGAILIAIGLLLWFHPVQRMFYSIVAVLLAVAALVASNLGGFLLGTILGIIGASLGFAWMPGRPERRRGRRRPAGPDEADGQRLVEPGEPAAESADSAEPAAHAEPAAGHEQGTVLHGLALLPILALLLGLPSALTAAAVDPSPSASAAADPTASATPDPSASATPSPPPSPGPSAVPAASPSPQPSSGGSGSGSGGSASASPSPTPTPTPTGTAPPFAVATAQSTLTATSATLAGFAYDGVVSVPTASGSVQMMEFSATSIDLTGATLAVSQGGATLTTTADSLDFSGKVLLYATQLSGDIGPLSVTLTPGNAVATLLQILSQLGLSQSVTQAFPLTMTNVTTLQPYASAGSLTASALQIS